MTNVVRCSLLGVLNAAALWACVGDDPDLSGDRTPTDAGTTSDATGTLDSPAASPPDGSTDGAEAGLHEEAAYIFATSEKYNGGKFGGLTGADAKCDALAKSKKFAGVYRAWLSSETTDAITRIQGNGPWRRLNDEAIVFQSRSALAAVPLVPVLYDENGTSVASSPNVWTGTTVGGTRGADTCTDWLSSDGAETGIVGFADQSDSRWTDIGSGEPCNDFVRLLCLRAD